MSREQARAVLPQSLMTSFVMTGNLLNWVKFLRLRLDEHAQPECRSVAKLIRDIAAVRYPETLRVFGYNKIVGVGLRTVGVVGLGYVGLPLAVHFADRGYRVVAYDIDVEKIKSLSECKSYIEDVTDADIRRVSGSIEPTSNVADLEGAECISVCVPTPVSGAEPNITPIMSALHALEGVVSEGCVLVIESTVYPNFTREKAAPLFPQAHVVFSPERVDPKNAKYAIEDIPKVIGADSLEAMAKAKGILRLIYAEGDYIHIRCGNE